MSNTAKTREQLLSEHILQTIALANFDKAREDYRVDYEKNVKDAVEVNGELEISAESRRLAERLGRVRLMRDDIFSDFPEHTEEEDKRRREYQEELEAEGVDVFAGYFKEPRR